MAWMKMLSDTYDAYEHLVGKEINDQPVLLPICHSTVNAQIELALDWDGTVIPRTSRLIPKEGNDKITIIPVTEDSAARGNGIAPHPLVDKLCYLAGDYSFYTKEKKSKEEYYKNYMEGLRDWAESPFTHKAVQVVYQYLAKGCLIKDLLSMKLLQLDENGILSDQVNKLQNQGQTGAVVRFCVGLEAEKELWKLEKLYQLYIDYYKERKREKDLCYVTGIQTVCSDKHPSKIRNSGDKAKLLSGNDDSGFTYRGRFSKKEEVVKVGFETSQKAHNALRWLLQKQGYTRDEAAIVAWEIHGKAVPGIICDTIDAFLSETEEEDEIDFYYETEEINNSTGELFAKKLNQAIAGYTANLTENDRVILMAMDAATTGRLSITYYHERTGNQFIQSVCNWHRKCVWPRYVEVEKGKKCWLECAPSPRDIALAAFGAERNKGYLDADKKLLRSTVERILPCIINDNRMIPKDIVKAAVNRASSPEAFTPFLWENQVFRVACALIQYNWVIKNHYLGGEKMNLEDEKLSKDRSFLFGRLLAVLDETERYAMRNEEKDRLTNAKRYWNAYSRRPATTYATIKRQVVPYLRRLKNNKIAYYDDITQEITSLMLSDDFNDKPLNELYLPGYYCQREEFRNYNVKNIEETGGKDDE